MTDLDAFVSRATALTRGLEEPADCVLALAPLMLELIGQTSQFLTAQHYRSDPDHYARNLVYRGLARLSILLGGEGGTPST